MNYRNKYNQLTLTSLNTNKHGLKFGYMPHPHFKNFKILTINGKITNIDDNNMNDLLYKAELHLKTLDNEPYLQGSKRHLIK